jgi:methionyl-tRNA formyltransferase
VLRIYASRVADAEALTGDAGGPPPAPGTVAYSADRHPLVRTGSGWLKLVEMQWEGKPRVKGPDFVNGLQPAEREALRFGSA